MKLIIQLLFLFNLTFSFVQSQLLVNCYQDLTNNLQNNIAIDALSIEYGLCGATPSFYVAIFDTNCIAWQTYYQGNGWNDRGNFNNDGVCRPRSESYFIYHQDDFTQLQNLDSLINFWIPNNHTFIIYTPLTFSFSSVNAINPQLGQTLLNNWGNELLDARMAIMFGVKGFANSYDIDTTITLGKIEYIQNICPHFEQTVTIQDDHSLDNNIIITPNPIGTELNIKITDLKSVDLKKIELYNEISVRVKTFSLEKNISGEYMFSVADLPYGLYFVSLYDSYNKKIGSITVLKK